MEPPVPRFEIEKRRWINRWRWVLIGGHSEVMARSPWYLSRPAAKASASATRHVANGADLWDPPT